MSAAEPPGDRPARKRMLPSVSDVVQQLAKLYPKAEPSLVFKAAREVCAEELNRVKQGHESAPVASLVERAAQRLAPLLGMAAPAAPAPAPHPSATVAPADSVFEETTGALDLKWDKERSEPLADAMTPTMAGDAFDVAPPPPQSHVLTEPTASIAHEDIGMGEDTLTNLQKEAKSVDLGSVIPQAAPRFPSEPTERMDAHRAPHREPESASPGHGRREPTVREWSGVVHEEPSGTSHVLLYSLVAVVALAAGFGAYTYFGVGRSSPGPFPNVPHKARRTPAASTSTPPAAATSAPAPEATPASRGAKVEATRPPAVVVKPAPTAAITLKPAGPVAAPTSAPAVRPTPAPRIAVAPTPVPVPVKVPAPPPLSATTTTAGGSQKGRAAALATKDWAGKPPVFTLHFSSYKDRASADKEAAQLGKKYGHPGHGVEVDLGEKGTWYRVVVGEFATVDEARAFRDELLAQGTKGVGFVYRLEGK